MRWPMILGFGILREAADEGSEGSSGAEGKAPVVNTKIKIGDEDVDVKDAKGALSLYRALQDPDTGSEIIETLARKAGLLDKKGELKDDTSTAKQVGKIRKALESKLGKEYGKFSAEVGDVLDDSIREYLDELREEAKSSSSANSWSGHVDKFTENHTLTPEIENKMKELMEEAPPNLTGKSFDPQRYLRRVYNNAISELDIEEPKPRKSAKSRRDNDDDLPEFVVKEGPKNRTVDDNIEAAMRGIRFKRQSD